MIELKVPDMTCGHCVSTVTKAVKSADPGAKVDISLDDRRVRVESRLTASELSRCISDAGFTPQAG